MALLQPVEISSAPEKVVQTYDRVREMFADSAVPAPFLIYANVEPFLRDFYMNFKKFVYTDGALDVRSKAVIGLAVAAHGQSEPWVEYFRQRCLSLGLTSSQVAEVLAVAATNYMYNTFFKFRDLSGSDLFSGMGVGLRANTFTGTSLDEKTIELIAIAVSDLNACGPCVSGHVEKARKLGLAPEQILECIQCAATMYAGVQFLNAVA